MTSTDYPITTIPTYEAANDSDSAPLWVWITLSVITCISFWLQATVTEERFVPALNVIANYYGIPDDIAGATLMAAGASSPELFSSFVSLFITHSSLGLGTIVGSEIFNQLIICTGAIYASKTEGLKLDPAIVTREAGFYGFSIIVLFLALQDSRPDPSDESGENHIYISFFESCYVFGGYILYVIVCANMADIVAFVTRSKNVEKVSDETDFLTTPDNSNNYGATGTLVKGMSRVNISVVDNHQMYFLREQSLLNHEPTDNFEKVEFDVTPEGGILTEDQEGLRTAASHSIRNFKVMKTALSNVSQTSTTSEYRTSVTQYVTERNRRFSDGNELRKVEYVMTQKKPSEDHKLMDIEKNGFEGRLSCFMWQRSYFYNKARLATHGWDLRWFNFFPDMITSVPDRSDADQHKVVYPWFEQVDIDESRMIIRIVNPKENRRNYYLMAPSREIMDAVVKKLEEILELRSAATEEDKKEAETEALEVLGDDFHDEAEVSLIEYPTGSSAMVKFFFIFLYPFRFLMHWTVPDVKSTDGNGIPTAKLSTAYLNVFMCLVWLVIGSYAMVSSLEHLADMMKVPTAVVGVTVSAAGTSLPNYVASKIAAEKGFGNMAVSNAFGSNTFNIMVGLGLPWLIYTSFGTGFKPYHGLRDEGIFDSVVILAGVLAVFVVCVLQSGFVLYKFHANLFALMYVAYIAYEVVRVYT